MQTAVRSLGESFRTWAADSGEYVPEVAQRGLDSAARREREAGKISAFDELLCLGGLVIGSPNPEYAQALLETLAEIDRLVDSVPELLDEDDAPIVARVRELVLGMPDGADALHRAEMRVREHLGRVARKEGLSVPDLALRRWGAPVSDYPIPGESAAAAARREHARARRLVASCVERLCSQPRVDTIFDVPTLADSDLRLALRWADPVFDLPAADEPDRLRALLVERLGKDSELARVLSARAAELVAMDFYRQLAADVRDVSALQLADATGDWATHDVLVNGAPVDVKNVRRDKDAPDRYSAHWVPQFKRHRRLNASDHVQICGVISYYLWPETLLNTASDFALERPTLVLGVTSAPRLVTLAREFKDIVTLTFKDRAQEGQSFLPSWVFELPPAAARLDDSGLVLVTSDAVAALQVLGPAPRLLSVLLAVADGDTVLADDALSAHARAFAECWLPARQVLGRTLPAVFLAVLRYGLRSLRGDFDEAGRFTADRARSLVFAAGDRSPLGTWDPLASVAALVDVLGELGEGDAQSLSKFREFKLSSRGILRGRESEAAKWTTLVTYCGACGANPLVLGRNAACVNGYLTCQDSKCGRCCGSCPHAGKTNGARHSEAS